MTEVIGNIVWSITRGCQNDAARCGKTVCAPHNTSTGLLKADPQVLDGLPATSANELLVRLRIRPITLHLAQGSGEVLSDVSSGEP